MTTDESPKPARTRLWLRIMLVVSLAFNLLIIGAVAGIMDAGAHDILVVPHAHGTKRTRVPIVDHALRAMDPSDGRITLAPLEEWAPEGLADDIPGWSGGDDE